MAPEDLEIVAASRPYPGETANGDAWQVDWYQGACRVAVIDGLGHGPEAARAAQAAPKTLRLRPELSPGDALRACHSPLGATRGAAISVATITAELQELIYAGVGNVDAHLFGQGRQQRLAPGRGIVGAALPTVHPLSLRLQGEWLFLIHTDGIRSRLQLEDLPTEFQTNTQNLADGILAGWGRHTDDATIVIIRPVR